jgi:hypothetical protein
MKRRMLKGVAKVWILKRLVRRFSRNRHGRTLAAGAGALALGRMGALALGSFALGAFAVGALAIRWLAVGRLAIGAAKVGRLDIHDLAVTGSMRLPGNAGRMIPA